MKKTFLATFLLFSNNVLAHAELEQAIPAANSILKSSPTTIKLKFGEGIESKFSVFKVYFLDNEKQDTKHLNAAAAALVSKVLNKQESDENRVDLGFTVTNDNTEVTIKLKSNLKTGNYVVMWKLLSIDSHILQDFYVFTVAK